MDAAARGARGSSRSSSIVDAVVDQMDGLDALGIREVLDADSRPTFIIDLDPDQPSRSVSTCIAPVFCNAALRSHDRLLDAVLGRDAPAVPPAVTAAAESSAPASASASTPASTPASTSASGSALSDLDPAHHGPDPGGSRSLGPSHEAFKRWVTGVTTHDDSKDVFPLSFMYHEMLWTGSTVRKRWRIISGNRLWRADVPVVDLASGAPLEVATGGSRASQATKKSSPGAPGASYESVAQTSGPPNVVSSSSPSGPLTSSDPVFYPRTSANGSVLTGVSNKNIAIDLSALPERATIDWTVPNPEGQISQHLEYVRAVDWGATSLGPMSSWSAEFRQIANLVMTNPHPAALFWGSKLTVIYNEAYANEVAGNKHVCTVLSACG